MAAPIDDIKSGKFSSDGSPWIKISVGSANSLIYSVDGSPWWGANTHDPCYTFDETIANFDSNIITFDNYCEEVTTTTTTTTPDQWKIYVGDTLISAMYLGATEVTTAYLGATELRG